jgi:hypothetical protein
MELRKNSTVCKSTRGVRKAATREEPCPALSNIADLIGYGDITIGHHRGVGCIATACDEARSLAVLVRRKGESLFQLLSRLDQAIQKAQDKDIFTDEIN